MRFPQLRRLLDSARRRVVRRRESRIRCRRGRFVNIELLEIRTLLSGNSQTITENSPPTAQDDLYDPLPAHRKLIVRAGDGVLSNDTDLDGHVLSVSLVSPPQHAKNFILNSDGSFRYKRDFTFVGIDTFTYMAEDPFGGNDQASVYISVAGPGPGPTMDLFELPVITDEGELGTFYATATSGAGGLTFQWDFGDGAVGTGGNVEHACDDGDYMITLFSDGYGATDTRQGVVAIENVAPSAVVLDGARSDGHALSTLKIFDDQVSDLLLGGQATDLFFAKLETVWDLTDRHPSETLVAFLSEGCA